MKTIRVHISGDLAANAVIGEDRVVLMTTLSIVRHFCNHSPQLVQFFKRNNIISFRFFFKIRTVKDFEIIIFFTSMISLFEPV